MKVLVTVITEPHPPIPYLFQVILTRPHQPQHSPTKSISTHLTLPQFLAFLTSQGTQTPHPQKQKKEVFPALGDTSKCHTEPSALTPQAPLEANFLAPQ